jgi:NAD(P)-dependent dehydrogenase (short-subunit alcohol dehydrogenase family)
MGSLYTSQKGLSGVSGGVEMAKHPDFQGFLASDYFRNRLLYPLSYGGLECLIVPHAGAGAKSSPLPGQPRAIRYPNREATPSIAPGGDAMPTVLITGANRGLGLEFARQYAARGWAVLACCRRPDEARELAAIRGPEIHALDVRDLEAVAALARSLKGRPIDLLLNNAGVYGPNKMTLGHLDYAAWQEVFAVNVLAPARLAECFVENVAASDRKLIACISSKMGSIAANAGGGHYLYRSSKAALNAVVKSLAIDLRGRGVTVVTLHPGWVRTDMGGADADLAIPESVAGVIGVLDKVGIEESGRFFDYDGSEIPW